MSPELIAAIIAAGVSLLTLIVSVLAQIYGISKTSADTVATLKAQSTQLDETLREQSRQTDKTLQEQSRQLDRTLAQQRDRTLNERFSTAADKLGSDRPPAVRLAGVYAMAGLADDWPENRQTCVDVLCAYLRLPYEPDPGNRASPHAQLSFGASREVRHTVIRVITAHLRPGAAVSWQALNFDFTGVVFDGGDFSGAVFSGGTVTFDGATFSGGTVSFDKATFSGGAVSFDKATFSGGTVSFDKATFSGGLIRFEKSEFTGGHVSFAARFDGASASFDRAYFNGGSVSFSGADFSSGQISFGESKFSSGQVAFAAAFSGSTVGFQNANLVGGQISFAGAEFSRGLVTFDQAEFNGSQVTFGAAARFAGSPFLNVFPAKFNGGIVDLTGSTGWSSAPPLFPDWQNVPAGLRIPPVLSVRRRREAPGGPAWPVVRRRFASRFPRAPGDWPAGAPRAGDVSATPSASLYQMRQ